MNTNRLSSSRIVVKILVFASLILFAFVFQACFYIEPIEPDLEEKPYPPTIDMLAGTSPKMGMISLNLNEGGKIPFNVSLFNDLNAKDTLYWRWIVDYGTMVSASFPMSILPEQREDAQLTFEFAACDSTYLANVADGKTVVIYIALSDVQFSNHGQSFRGDQIRTPFETLAENYSPIWVNWTVQFKGNCPVQN